jgi:cell wall assembly regulator SMI1
MTADFAGVLDLLGRAPRPPEEAPPVGATAAELATLEHTLGFPLPNDLRAWLTVCRGSLAGPGGLYGVDTAPTSIASVLDLYPDWRDRRWIPVAGDGCGNHDVLEAGAVFFVDTMASVDAFDYVVASGLIPFLTFLLERELGAKGWPFDADYVFARDPALAHVSEPSLLPWND